MGTCVSRTTELKDCSATHTVGGRLAGRRYMPRSSPPLNTEAKKADARSQSSNGPWPFSRDRRAMSGDGATQIDLFSILQRMPLALAAIVRTTVTVPIPGTTHDVRDETKCRSTFAFADANAEMCRLLGMTLHQLVGTLVESIIPDFHPMAHSSISGNFRRTTPAGFYQWTAVWMPDQGWWMLTLQDASEVDMIRSKLATVQDERDRAAVVLKRLAPWLSSWNASPPSPRHHDLVVVGVVRFASTVKPPRIQTASDQVAEFTRHSAWISELERLAAKFGIIKLDAFGDLFSVADLLTDTKFYGGKDVKELEADEGVGAVHEGGIRLIVPDKQMDPLLAGVKRIALFLQSAIALGRSRWRLRLGAAMDVSWAVAGPVGECGGTKFALSAPCLERAAHLSFSRLDGLVHLFDDLARLIAPPLNSSPFCLFVPPLQSTVEEDIHKLGRVRHRAIHILSQ